MSRSASRYNTRQGRRYQPKSIARDRAASVLATRRCMISATGRISLIAPAVCQADHYRRGRRAKAEATVEHGSPHAANPARDWCRERAMLAIEVHRHRSSPTLDRHGIYGGLDLAAADRPHQQNANWRSIPGLRATVGCPLGYTKLLFATTPAGGRHGWTADLRRLLSGYRLFQHNPPIPDLPVLAPG
jgi:hypothetical protein